MSKYFCSKDLAVMMICLHFFDWKRFVLGLYFQYTSPRHEAYFRIKLS